VRRPSLAPLDPWQFTGQRSHRKQSEFNFNGNRQMPGEAEFFFVTSEGLKKQGCTSTG
jgi:hypothetical protein